MNILSLHIVCFMVVLNKFQTPLAREIRPESDTLCYIISWFECIFEVRPFKNKVYLVHLVILY